MERRVGVAASGRQVQPVLTVPGENSSLPAWPAGQE